MMTSTKTDHHERVTDMTAAKELTTAEFATELNTDPRTVRKYLRSVTPRDAQPGKGSRWVLPGTKTAITKHRKDFAIWQKAQADAAADRAAKAAKDAADLIPDDIEQAEDDFTPDEVEDMDAEPTDEDLEDIDED
jgi:hypothetical protein